ncbi:MAG: GNAT family N-acetyltransferase, partial [Tepidiformaceae bacterium]
MSEFFVAAEAVGDELRGQLAILLSRAYTDGRHLADYSAEERLKWAPYFEAVTADVSERGPVMPREWLARFPTMRNLWREPAERLASCHFIARKGPHLAGHVGMFAHDFRLGATEPIPAAFIEDVATDPLDLGTGIATQLLTAAREHAAASGAAIMGLSTNIPRFYERLGWRSWE